MTLGIHSKHFRFTPRGGGGGGGGGGRRHCLWGVCKSQKDSVSCMANTHLSTCHPLHLLAVRVLQCNGNLPDAWDEITWQFQLPDMLQSFTDSSHLEM